MSAALASFVHIASLVVGLACLFARSAFLGGSALGAAHRSLSRWVDLAMMMPGRAPDPGEPVLDERQMRRALTADTISLVAGTLWVVSGLWRAAGLEKSTEWYLGNDLFVLKMVLVCVVMALEMAPMLLLIQWRYALGLRAERARRALDGDASAITFGPLMRLFLRGGEEPSVRWLPPLRRVFLAEELVIVLALLVAPFMARGIGYDLWSEPAAISAEPCAVEALLQARCGRCHQGAGAQGGLDLDVGIAAWVDAPSALYPGAVRVRPGDPSGSLLMQKLEGPPADRGAPMPLGGALPAGEIAAARGWIAAGALPCAE